MAAGFPSGQFRLESKVLEVKLAAEDGAEEIDIVISRALALQGHWKGPSRPYPPLERQAQ